MTNGNSNATLRESGAHLIKNYWKPLSVLLFGFWAVVVMAWPTMKEKMDIASAKATSQQIQTLTQALNDLSKVVSQNSLTNAGTKQNLAIATVLLAQATKRITDGQANYMIIQISNGEFDQSKLIKELIQNQE